MMQFIKITTVEGTRWDTIAQQMYGDSAQFQRIVDANPEVPATPRLPGGIELRVPIIDAPPDTIAAETLPPWKR